MVFFLEVTYLEQKMEDEHIGFSYLLTKIRLRTWIFSESNIFLKVH